MSRVAVIGNTARAIDLAGTPDEVKKRVLRGVNL